MNRPSECRPSVTIRAGSRTSSWRWRYGAQAAISSGSGSRLSGGRHFTTFVMKTSSRRQLERAEELRQQVAGAADERPAEPVLVEARALADEDDLGVGAALARDGVRAGLVEPAAGAGADLRRDRPRAPPGARRGSRRPSGGRGRRCRGTVRRRRRGAARRAPDPAAGDERLGDLDRVRRRALAEVVADDPEREAAAVGDRTSSAGPGRRRSRRCRRRRSRAGTSRSTGRPGRRRPATAREQLAGPVRGRAARGSRRGPPRSGRRRPARGPPCTRCGGPAGGGSCGSR